MYKYLSLFVILLISDVLIAQTQGIAFLNANDAIEILKVNAGEKNPQVYYPEEKRFALVMGVSDYDYLMPQPCVKNDVDSVRIALQKSGFDVAVALNKTKSEFDTIIKLSRDYCVKNNYNIILVYFSGIGQQILNCQMLAAKDFYYTASDTSGKLKEFMDNSILLPEVVDNFNIPDAKAVLALTDACRSFDVSTVTKKENPFSLEVIQKFNKLGKLIEEKGNVGLIYSTLIGEYSYQSTTNSVFTKYLVNILNKKPTNFGDLALKLFQEMKAGGEKQMPFNPSNPISYDFNFFRPAKADPQTIIKNTESNTLQPTFKAQFLPYTWGSKEPYEFVAKQLPNNTFSISFNFRTLYGSKEKYVKTDVVKVELTIGSDESLITKKYLLTPNSVAKRRSQKIEYSNVYTIGRAFNLLEIWDQLPDFKDALLSGKNAKLYLGATVYDYNNNILFENLDLTQLQFYGVGK